MKTLQLKANAWYSHLYFHLICSRRRHDASTEEFANRPKSISASLQCVLKHIMPVRRVLLGFPERTNIVVCRSTLWTLCFHTIRLIEAALVKGVFAKKVHRWQIQAPTTRSAPPGLKDSRLIAQIVHLFSLGLGLGTVAFDETTILESVSRLYCGQSSMTYI